MDMINKKMTKSIESKKAFLFILKQQPPRPGLVPQSGDYQHPKHWVLPEYEKHSHDDLFKELSDRRDELKQNTRDFIESVYRYYKKNKTITPRQREVLEKIHATLDKNKSKQSIEQPKFESSYEKSSNKELQGIASALMKPGLGWSGANRQNQTNRLRELNKVVTEINKRKKEGTWEETKPNVEEQSINKPSAQVTQGSISTSPLSPATKNVPKPEIPPKPGLELDPTRQRWIRPGLVGSKTKIAEEEKQKVEANFKQMSDAKFDLISTPWRLARLKDHELATYKKEYVRRYPNYSKDNLTRNAMYNIELEEKKRKEKQYERAPKNPDYWTSETQPRGPKQYFGD